MAGGKQKIRKEEKGKQGEGAAQPTDKERTKIRQASVGDVGRSLFETSMVSALRSIITWPVASSLPG